MYGGEAADTWKEHHMFTETQRKRRGHNFLPPKRDLARIPGLGGQESAGTAAIIHLHYFVGGWDWYITELDPATGEVFGVVTSPMTGPEGEYGYSSLAEMEGVRAGINVVERDLDWQPVPLSAVRGV